jgi:hypothetical protein
MVAGIMKRAKTFALRATGYERASLVNVALSGKFPTMPVRAGVQAIRERNGFDFGGATAPKYFRAARRLSNS